MALGASGHLWARGHMMWPSYPYARASLQEALLVTHVPESFPGLFFSLLLGQWMESERMV